MKRLGPALYALPGLAFLAVFFLYPVVQLLALSLRNEGTGEFTLQHFEHALGTEVYVRVLGITFTIARRRPWARCCSAIRWRIGWRGCRMGGGAGSSCW